MNDIKILWEFAKSHSCYEELKAVIRLEKFFWCIGLLVTARHICVAERESAIWADIIEDFFNSAIFTTKNSA